MHTTAECSQGSRNKNLFSPFIKNYFFQSRLHKIFDNTAPSGGGLWFNFILYSNSDYSPMQPVTVAGAAENIYVDGESEDNDSDE